MNRYRMVVRQFQDDDEPTVADLELDPQGPLVWWEAVEAEKTELRKKVLAEVWDRWVHSGQSLSEVLAEMGHKP